MDVQNYQDFQKEIDSASATDIKEKYLELFKDFQLALEVNRKLVNLTGEILTELEKKNELLKLKFEGFKGGTV